MSNVHSAATAAGAAVFAVAALLASPTGTARADASSDLVGPGCAAYAQKVPSGPGSVAGMAPDSVAVAGSHNPMLTTLTAALSGKLNPPAR